MLKKLTVIALFVLGPVLCGESIDFKNSGKPVRSLSQNELQQLVPATQIKIYEPHEKRNVEYKGVAVRKLFDAVYKDAWKNADEILFTCADGYQPSVPVSKFKKYSAYLVFAKSDGEFTMTNKLQNNEKVKLGPYYLVWDNLKDPALKAEGGSDFPYQVVGVELVDFETRFPGMTPPKKRNRNVEKGFLAFRKNCMACHTINGEGGAKAVELNYPANVTEIMKTGWLRRWILDPTSVRYNTTMPALNPEDPKRAETARDIIAYLREMKKHKRVPKRRD